MGKKSLIKSTSKKKKSASKKKEEEKKTKNPKKKGAAVKSKAAKKPAKKKAAPKKKKVTLKDLLFKKFDIEVPDKLYKVEPAGTEQYTAPPLISTTDKKEAERLKKLLFKKFDLTAPAVDEKIEKEKKPKKPAKGPVKKKPVLKKEKVPDYKEIMSRKFLERKTAKMSSADLEKEKKEFFSAPPIIDTQDTQEARRLKGILFRKFDIPPSPPTQPETVKAEAAQESEKPVPSTAAEQDNTPGEGIEQESGKEKEPEPEKAAARAEKIKKEEESPKVSVSYDEPPPTDTEVSDPMDKMIKYGIAVFVLLILLIVGYSFANSNNYYIRDTQEGIEIWKGKFAPMGAEKLLFIPGAKPPEADKEVYSAQEVMPLAYNYYVDKADSLLEIDGIPDFEKVRDNLQNALAYATTQKQRAAVDVRLDALKGLILQFKANVAASRGTVSDLSTAIALLQDAMKLELDPLQKEMIQTKIANLEQLAQEKKAEQTKAETVAAEAKKPAAPEKAPAEATQKAPSEKTPSEAPSGKEPAKAPAEAPAKEAAGH